MDRMPDSVTGGVDTHRDVHVAAVLDHLGRVLGTGSFPANRAGYRQLARWFTGLGTVGRVGVEGTGSWGAGLTRHLQAAGIEVVEVIRPNRQSRRRYGKSDVTDAIAAARAVLSGEAAGTPRGGDGPIEAIRFLKIARRSAMKHRTAVVNQIRSVIATAPDELRATLRDATLATIVTRVTRYRTTGPTDPTAAAKITLRALGARYRYLTTEITDLDRHLKHLVTVVAPPELLAKCGVGTQTASDLLLAAGTNPDRVTSDAAFAALCGSSPVDASSGTHQHHRLNRGGDRQANAALYRIALVRMRHHQPTRDYVTRRLAQGRTKPDTIRCLKRYIAREIWTTLTQPQPT